MLQKLFVFVSNEKNTHQENENNVDLSTGLIV
jgi:hypothetical protein